MKRFDRLSRQQPLHAPARRPCRNRPCVETLEVRLLLATGFTQTNLVSDIAGMAKTTDPNLVNPWGLALGLGSGFWVANNRSGTATVYDGNGKPLPAATPLIVSIPTPSGTGTSAPTGEVSNATQGFTVSSNGKTGASNFLFATEDGTIAGWSAAVDLTHAFIAADNSASGAVYKGLAQGFNPTGAYLYATNFHAGTVDVFDRNFAPVKIPGAFTDTGIPAGYAPFGIQAINGDLYVTYAQQDAAKHDDIRGAGHGFIDVFDTEGHLLKRFTSQGQLNSPWGMAWAPIQGYGDFNNALLVGNFGDGTINAFDFDSGAFLGKLSDSTGKAITNDGLWALSFGDGVQSTSPNTLYFTSGPNDEHDGLFGSLNLNPTTTPLPQPVMTDPNLSVTTVVTGLDQPTNLTFLGAGDLIVLEKASGKIQHVVNGTLATPIQFVTPAGATLPNLPVNNASERGLLGVALDPNFATNHAVYLYWTESSTGAVSGVLSEVGNANSAFPPGTVKPLGNRVDRFILNEQANTLTFDKNLIELHAFQQDNIDPVDATEPLRGNHNSGEIRFGPDGKLYIMIGDNGRRGQLQNLPAGWKGNGQSDDQFGGPAPDNNHLTGVILRLNPDGTTPTDNPFASVTVAQVAALEQAFGVTLTDAQLAEVTANIHKIFSYGRRNGFGLAFDPITGSLWESENGDDTFDELNRVTAGSNGGWTQFMGPLAELELFKAIESTFTPVQGNLGFSGTDPASFIPATQQVRWNPANSADTPQEALARLFTIPGSHYEDPQFSWVWAVAPAGIGFVGKGLGAQYAGDMFVGESRTFLDNGYLFDFKFNASRDQFAFSDPKLADKVDNNNYKFGSGESDSLVIGKNFGIATDIETGPDGNLYVVSLSNGAIYMIKSTAQTPIPTPTPTPTPAPQSVVSATSISQAPGRNFRGTVATFVDPVPGRTAKDFSVAISWGDGTATAGTVSAASDGSFVVSGSHRYRRRGTYHVVVAVSDAQGESGVGAGTATIKRKGLHARQALAASLSHVEITGFVPHETTHALRGSGSRHRTRVNQGTTFTAVSSKHAVHDIALKSVAASGRHRH
ncbi:MAG: gdhB 2 [Planctomycetota bacterium]|nr:gdhB 2 [Planctomycetota bacterium]